MHPQIYKDIYHAALTHWWFCGECNIVASLLRRLAPERRSLRIADVGCGMGAILEMLGEFGWVAGLDYSATALPSLPFADAELDIVCTLGVIEHIHDDAQAVNLYDSAT